MSTREKEGSDRGDKQKEVCQGGHSQQMREGEESRSAPASILMRASNCKFRGAIGSFAEDFGC